MRISLLYQTYFLPEVLLSSARRLLRLSAPPCCSGSCLWLQCTSVTLNPFGIYPVTVTLSHDNAVWGTSSIYCFFLNIISEYPKALMSCLLPLLRLYCLNINFIFPQDNSWGNPRWRRWDSPQERLRGETFGDNGQELHVDKWPGRNESHRMCVPGNTHTGLFGPRQSLDYDRCINEPYVEILEGMDNQVGPFTCVPCWVIAPMWTVVLESVQIGCVLCVFLEDRCVFL